MWNILSKLYASARHCSSVLATCPRGVRRPLRARRCVLPHAANLWVPFAGELCVAAGRYEVLDEVRYDHGA